MVGFPVVFVFWRPLVSRSCVGWDWLHKRAVKTGLVTVYAERDIIGYRHGPGTNQVNWCRSQIHLIFFLIDQVHMSNAISQFWLTAAPLENSSHIIIIWEYSCSRNVKVYSICWRDLTRLSVRFLTMVFTVVPSMPNTIYGNPSKRIASPRMPEIYTYKNEFRGNALITRAWARERGDIIVEQCVPQLDPMFANTSFEHCCSWRN